MSHGIENKAGISGKASPSNTKSNFYSFSIKASKLLIAACASGKGILGTGLLVAQLAEQAISSPGAVASMVVSAFINMGFYTKQIDDGLGMAAELSKGVKPKNHKNEEAAPLLQTNSTYIQASLRYKTLALIVAGSFGFATVQGWSLLQAGGASAFSIAFATAIFSSNLILSPPNVAFLLGQIGYLKEEEIQFLHPKDSATRSKSSLNNAIILGFAVMATSTNLINGTSPLLSLLQHFTSFGRGTALPIKISAILGSFLFSLACSAVPIGMNVDGLNRTLASIRSQEGFLNFLKENQNWLFLLMVAIGSALPSTYTATVSASSVLQDTFSLFGNTTIITVDKILQEKTFPHDPLNIVLISSLLTNALITILAQISNKGPATRNLVMEIKELICNICSNNNRELPPPNLPILQPIQSEGQPTQSEGLPTPIPSPASLPFLDATAANTLTTELPNNPPHTP